MFINYFSLLFSISNLIISKNKSNTYRIYMNHFYLYYNIINIYLLLIFIVKYKKIFNQQIFTIKSKSSIVIKTNKLFIYFVIRCSENGIEFFFILCNTFKTFYYMYNILYKYNIEVFLNYYRKYDNTIKLIFVMSK